MSIHDSDDGMYFQHLYPMNLMLEHEMQSRNIWNIRFNKNERKKCVCTYYMVLANVVIRTMVTAVR